MIYVRILLIIVRTVVLLLLELIAENVFQITKEINMLLLTKLVRNALKVNF